MPSLADLQDNPNFQQLSPEAKVEAFNRLAIETPGFSGLSPAAQAEVRRRLGVTETPQEPSAARSFLQPTVTWAERVKERLQESGEAVLGLPSIFRKWITGEAQGGLSDVVTGKAKPVTFGDVAHTSLQAIGAPFTPIFAPIGEAVRTAAEGFVNPETARTIGNVGEMAAGVALPFVKVPATPVTRGLTRVGIGRLPEEAVAIERATQEAMKAPAIAEALRPSPAPATVPEIPTPPAPTITDLTRAFRAAQTEGGSLAEQIATLERAGLPVPRSLREAYERTVQVMRGPEVPPMPEPIRAAVASRSPRPQATPAVEPPSSPRVVAPVQEPLLSERVSEQATGAIADAAKNAADALAQTQASAEGKRLFRQVAEALETGQISVPDLPDVLRRSNMSMTDFVSDYAETISTAGRQLQQLSALRRYLDRIVGAAAEASPDAARALQILNERAPAQTLWQKLMYGAGRWPGYVAIDNVRRASLVSQVATTARNVLSQTGRYGLEVLDQAVQRVTGGDTAGNATELIASFARNLPGRTNAELANVLDSLPLEAAKLSALPAGEVSLGSRWTRLINTLNTVQESFFRRAIFDATVRNELRHAGADVMTTLADPASIPKPIIETATQRALEATFAQTPQAGTFGSAVMRMYSAFPPLTTVNPFPRFLMNSYKFLTDFSPAGYLRLLGRDAEGALLAADPARRAQILSRASLGTGLLAGGLAIRNSDLAGEKWYEVRIGNRVMDARPYAPVSTYLFFGEVLKIMGEAGADTIRNGRDFLQALQSRSNMTVQDIVQGFLSINRIAGTGLVGVDLLRSGAMERKLDLLRDFAAQYVGGFTVPFRTIKDAIAGVSPQEAMMRDQREGLLAPAMANLPVVSTTLPARPSPLRAEIPRTETPWLRQATGISLRTKNPLEAEIDRLGIEFATIAPRTGMPLADRLIAAHMGPISERLIPVLRSPGYQGLSDAGKTVALGKLLGRVRTLATQQAQAEQPAVFLQNRLDRLPRPLRRLLQEQRPDLFSESMPPGVPEVIARAAAGGSRR